MPSIDPRTGKRLSGPQQKALTKARENNLRLFADLGQPPAEDGVEAIESWAAGLNLRAVVAIGAAVGTERERVRQLLVMIRAIGKLKDKARRAETAMKLRRRRLGGSDSIERDSPPFDDPVAIIPWCFHELAHLAYEVATAKTMPPGVADRVAILAQSGFLPCNGELGRISDRVDEQTVE